MAASQFPPLILKNSVQISRNNVGDFDVYNNITNGVWKLHAVQV